MAGEKILQLEYASGCVHVFLRSDPGNCRFVKINCFCDVVQYERLHGLGAILEKASLKLYYFS